MNELKSEHEYLKSIDSSLSTIKSIMLLWLILSIAAVILYALSRIN